MAVDLAEWSPLGLEQELKVQIPINCLADTMGCK